MSNYDFNERFLQDLRSAVDIVDVIGDVVTLKKAGKSYKGLCPFHGEKGPSFHVDRAKGLYYCFGCGVGGDALKFVIETEKIDFGEACERLARRFHVTIPERTGPRSKERDRVDFLRQVVSRTQQIFREEFARAGSPALPYLSGRGLSEETIGEFAFGWAPDRWDRVVGALARDFGEAALEEAGVAIRNPDKGTFYDRFRGRVMVPIHDAAGHIVAFGGRILGPGEPKYLNSPETPVFNKSRTLFNMNRARAEIRKREVAVLVEGYFDAISLVAGGFPHVVASLGTSFTDFHAEALKRLAPKVIVCYDGDEAGQNAAARALPILLGRDLDVSVAPLPPKEDPDTYLRTNGAEALERLFGAALDPVEFLLRRENDLASPAGRRSAAERVIEVLKTHPDRVFRYASVERLAERLSLPSSLLWEKLPGRKSGGSQSPSTPAPARDGQNLSGERRLLALLLESPELRGRAAQVLEENDLSLDEHREIFQALLSEELIDKPLDFREFIAHLKSDAAVAALSAIALGGGPEEQSGEFDSHVNLLQKRSLERLGESLQGEIHRLQNSGEDPARLDSLLKAKLELKRRIGRMGRPAPGDP